MSDDQAITKLLERYPKIRDYHGRRFLIKYGGAAMENLSTRLAVCREIALLHSIGVELIVVHGGGKEITRALTERGIYSTFIGGHRVTFPEAMLIIEQVLSGSVNKEIASCLTKYGAGALGISGRDGHLMEAVTIRGPLNEYLGSTGEVTHCKADIVTALLSAGFIPVISPVAETIQGTAINVNADYAAAALAGALGVDACVFLTDVAGVKVDGKLQPILSAEQIDALIASGVISGGMIPKVQCAVKAVSAGCKRADICQAGEEYIVTRAIIEEEATGTTIKE